jgi:hypothetical protein
MNPMSLYLILAPSQTINARNLREIRKMHCLKSYKIIFRNFLNLVFFYAKVLECFHNKMGEKLLSSCVKLKGQPNKIFYLPFIHR